MTTYAHAPEVADIAADLIRTVEQHKPLADVRIEYVWRDKASKSKGRTTLATARRIGGLNAFLLNGEDGPLYCIEVAADTWGKLTDPQRRALVDHEMCHFHVDEDPEGVPVLSMRGHDLEEFAAIVERHGMWKSDVASFGSVIAEQLAFAVEEAATFLDEIGKPPPNVDPDTGEVGE